MQGKFEGSVSLLAWGYNEEGLVADFLARALAVMEAAAHDFEIVFVDDGSSDRTAQVVEEMANHNSAIRLVRHDVNRNVGFACRTAVASARKQYLFWQTVDWSYDISNLRIYLELLKQVDVVQGFRPLPPTDQSTGLAALVNRIRMRSDNKRKALVSLINYYLLRVLFGLPFEDFQNVTFYPTALVQGLALRGRTSFINPEMMIKAHRTGASFLQVPIGFIPRSQGEAKGTKLKTIGRSVIDIFRNWLAWGLASRIQGGTGGSIGRFDQTDGLSAETRELLSRITRAS